MRKAFRTQKLNLSEDVINVKDVRVFPCDREAECCRNGGWSTKKRESGESCDWGTQIGMGKCAKGHFVQKKHPIRGKKREFVLKNIKNKNIHQIISNPPFPNLLSDERRQLVTTIHNDEVSPVQFREIQILIPLEKNKAFCQATAKP